jgi:hypothetical protein
LIVNVDLIVLDPTVTQPTSGKWYSVGEKEKEYIEPSLARDPLQSVELAGVPHGFDLVKPAGIPTVSKLMC